MTQKKNLILNDPPLKDIQGLVRRQVQSVALKVKRRAANNREAIIWPFRKDYPVDNLTNGQLEKDLMAHAGGGTYIVQMFDNENGLESLSPRWSVPLEGQPFDPQARPQYGAPPASPSFTVGGLGGFGGGFGQGFSAPHNIGGVTVPAAAIGAGLPTPPVNLQGDIMAPPPPHLMGSPEMANHDFRTQWQHVYDHQATAGGALDPVQRVGVDFAHKFDDRRETTLAEVARLQEQLANEKTSAMERMFALQQQNQGGGLAAVMPMMMGFMQQQQQQQERAAQQAMAQQQQNTQMMLAVLTRQPEQPKSGIDANLIAAIAAAVVPMATAYISHQSSTHQTQLQAQMKQQEMQQQAFQQMFLQGQQKTDLPSLLGAGAPILAALLTARQGSAELALQRQDQQSQNAMMQLKMMADMVAERAEAAGNPDLAEMVLRFAADIVPQLPGVMNAMRGKGGVAQAPQRPAALPPSTLAPQGQQVTVTAEQRAIFKRAQEMPQDATVDLNTSVANWAGLLEVDDDAAEATGWVVAEQLSKMGPAFTTIPWREAVFHAHHLSDPALTADRFRAVIDEAYNNEDFPPMVMRALENDTRQVLDSVMGNMPVTQMHPDYAKNVLDIFMAKLQQEQQANAVARAQAAVPPVQPVEVVKPAPPPAPTAQQAASPEGTPTKTLRVVPPAQEQEQPMQTQAQVPGPGVDDTEDEDLDEDDDDDDDDDDWGDEEDALGPEALITPGLTFPTGGIPS